MGWSGRDLKGGGKKNFGRGGGFREKETHFCDKKETANTGGWERFRRRLLVGERSRDETCL